MKRIINKGISYLVLFAFIIGTASIFGLLDPPAAPTSLYGVRGRKMTLVIDPGHGGEDGGAVSISGLRESALNLDIALRLDQIMGLYGVAPVLTRDSETIVYPDEAGSVRARKRSDQMHRLEIVSQAEDAVLISIHQNKYTSAGPSGAQVFYAPTAGSDVFANLMQEQLRTALNPGNARQAAKIPKTIFLLNSIDCPAILIECGFLSNPREEKLLDTEEYRLKIAAAVAAGYMRALGEIENGSIKRINES